MDRRQFLKIAGLSTVLGLGGGTAGAKMLFKAEPGTFTTTTEGLKAKQWALVIDMKKFRGPGDYQKCIDACRSAHNIPDIGNPKDEIKWIWKDDYEHTFPDQDNRFEDEKIREMPFLVLCNHCEKPACVRVCPTKATFKRKQDGIVMMDYHRCIGCRFCMAACPFGARSFNWRDPRPFIKKINPEYPTRMPGVVEKCTLCDERINKGLQPACVEACQDTKAIVFGDVQDPNSEVRKLLAENLTIRRKPELGTGPNVYYIIGGGNTNV